MSLLLVPEEVLAMGKLERDPKTHEPIFPETATKEQIAAYWEFVKCIQEASKRKAVIISLCGWEDDDIQNDNPDFVGGANDMSLNQAKEAYKNGEPVI